MQKKHMTEFTFLSASDAHISDQNPRSRTDNYKEAILDKITQFGKACNKLGADAAFFAGDLYNQKTPSKNSHALNKELIKVFKQFECPIYMIEGNHDLSANRIESLKEQPLGVLFEDGTLKQLRDAVIKKEGFKISLVGIPYKEDLELSSLVIPPKNDCVSQICLMHIYAGPKPGALFKERLYGYNELARLSPDVFILGHYHVNQGIEEAHKKHFINLGAMSRGALSEENIDHQPQMALIKIMVEDDKTVSYNIQPLKLKTRPSEEIFDVQKREEEKAEYKEIEAFVEKLIVESSVKKEEENFSDIITKMDIAKAVKDKVLYFIQEASSK